MSKCRLFVTQGVHAEASLTLADGAHLVGADLGCDIVLVDPGVMPQHLILHVEGGRIRLERLSDVPVTINGSVPDPGSPALHDGDVVGLGSAAFRLTGVEAPPVEATPSGADGEPPLLEIVGDAARAGRDTAGAEAAATAPEEEASQTGPERRTPRRHHPLFWVLPLFIAVGGGGAFFASQLLQASVPLPLPAPPAADQLPPDQRDQLLDRVREFLSDDGLAIRRDPKGAIVVSGTTRMDAVPGELQEIRKEFKNTVEIVDRVTYVSDNKAAKTIRLPQRILDVHVGRISWFQTADGRRNFEGSVLDDGAEVVHIGIDRIVFRRNGKLAVFNVNDEEQSK